MSDTEKKYYQLGAVTESDWDAIHAVMMQDGTLEDNIPSRSVECTDDMIHSPTRSIYLLTDQEAEQLKNHPGILFIHLDPNHYPEKFHVPTEELLMVPIYKEFKNR